MTKQLVVPSSKSDSQRALFVAALCHGESTIHNVLDCLDVNYLISALKQLGIKCENQGTTWKVWGCGDSPWCVNPSVLSLGNNGTASRLLMALSLIISPSVTITGNSYLKKRPFAPFIDTLKNFGVNYRYDESEGCLPITSQYQPLQELNTLVVDTSVSTQYLSALLMVSVLLSKSPSFLVHKSPEDLPYVEMTIKTMKAFGVNVEKEPINEQKTLYLVERKAYEACLNYQVEADWSSASYFVAASYITGKSWECSHLRADSLQSDRFITDVIDQFQAISTELTIDMRRSLDIIPSVVAMSFHRKSKTIITGTANLKYKECDRAMIMKREFAKLGGQMDIFENHLVVYPSTLELVEIIDPEDDHRMAMAITVALLGTSKHFFTNPLSFIKHPECVNKSFPDFFEKIAYFFD